MKKSLYLLVPLLIMSLTACVKYNGQGKNGSKAPKSSSAVTSVSSQGIGGTSIPGGSSIAPSSSATPSSSQEIEGDLPVGTAVKVYLVFGEYGLYKGNPVNTGVDSLFLEHTLELDTKVGDDLPGKTDVTSSVTGSQFVSWIAYNNIGSPTTYTKVPAVDKKILYASFSGGNGQGSQSSSAQPSSSSQGQSSQSSSSSLPSSQVTYTVTSLPTWIQTDGCIIFAWVWSNNDGGSWKSLSYGTNNDASFIVDEELTGFLLARCVAGTTQPDWSIKSGSEPGRVFNKTNDIACQAGVHSYVCSDWVEYNG
jgi:hypothetical protein